MYLRKYFLNLVLLILYSPMLIGCMMGPNFHRPPAPPVTHYTAEPLPAKTAATPNLGPAGKAQHFTTVSEVPADWWYLFHSSKLNYLIEKGLANSPNLAAAEQALYQARENLNVQVGNSLFPAFDGRLQGQRQRFSTASVGVPDGSSVFNIFNASVNVAYTLDIFGSARRQIESLKAQVDYQQYQWMAAYLTLTANIVTTAVTIAMLQEQIETTQLLITAQEDQLDLLKKQVELGGASEQNVLTQATLVAQTVATLPVLEKRLAQSRHALATLVGQYPSEPLPLIRLNELTLPTKLPITLPSTLVRQRPDILASEALLHAASAQVGVATANLFPQFSIVGAYGWQNATISNLFLSNNSVWSIGGSITQPIFHGGALQAQRRGAIAAYNQAAQQYRQTLLQAFQNVADTLRALDTDARALRAQREAEVAAKRSLNLTQQQYRLGGASYINLLNAQAQYQQIILNRIQAQATRYNDTAALFQALGGSWWRSAAFKKVCKKVCLS